MDRLTRIVSKRGVQWAAVLALALAPWLGRTLPAVEAAAPGPAVAVSNATAPDLDARVLHFPPEQWLGFLMVQDAGSRRKIESFEYQIDGTEWRPLAPAQGDVVVPAGKRVSLTINNSGHDYSCLENLGPYDLYSVKFLATDHSVPPLGDHVLRRLTGCRGLRELDLQNTNVTDRGLSALSAFPSLRRLWLPPRTTDAGMAQVTQLTSLHALYFGPTRVSNKGLAPIANLRNLRELVLGGKLIGDDALAHVAKIPRLEYLDLWGFNFSDAGVTHVTGMDSLRTLDVSHQAITDRGVRTIAQMPNLERLNLYGLGQLGNPGLAHLKNLPRLRKLNVSTPPNEKNRVTDEGIAHLVNCPNLEHLALARGLTNAGLAHAAKIKNLKVLNAFGSSSGPFSDEGLWHLSHLPHLEALEIGGRHITNVGLGHIAKLQNLHTLLLLSHSNAITDEGLTRIATLRQLRTVSLFLSKAPLTTSGLNQLNALTQITHFLGFAQFRRDVPLNLANWRLLEDMMFDSSTGLHGEDYAWLANAKGLRRLQGLRGLTDESLAYLAGLTELNLLSVQGKGITDQGLKHLASMQRLNSLTVKGNITGAGLANLAPLRALTVLTIESSSSVNSAAVARLKAALPQLSRVSVSRWDGR